MIRNIIFDWSGTLVNDLPAVLEATNYCFEQSGLPPLSEEEFRREFKLPFTGFYKKYLPDADPRQLEKWFHTRFAAIHAQSVVEIPQVREFLEFCKQAGMKRFVLSSVREDHFKIQANALGLADYFDDLYLGVWDKRDCIHRLLQKHQLRPDDTLFVGDMVHDVETAKHGGVYSCAVITGYTGLADLRESKPDWLVEHLGELLGLLRNGNGLIHKLDRAGECRFPIATVGALIYGLFGKVLMVRTRKWSDKWGIPGGKIEWNEGSEQALTREIQEETGLEIEDIRFVMCQDCIQPIEFYKPAHFLLLNYTCQMKRSVNGDPESLVRLNAEAQEFCWIQPQDALEQLPLNAPTELLLRKVLENQNLSQD